MYSKYITEFDSIDALGPPKAGLERLSKGAFYANRGSVEWSPSKGMVYYNRIKSIPFPRRFHLLSSDQDGSYQLNRFLIACDAYDESARRAIPTDEIIKRCCLEGPQYAKHLKEFRALSWKVRIFASKSRSSERYKGDTVDIKDIGDVFNYNYLIHWRTPVEEVNDFSLAFTPVDVNEETLDEFRDTAETVVEGLSLKVIAEKEILLRLTASKTFCTKSGKSECNWQLKERENGMSSSIGLVKRCIVDVGPANVRDAVILSPGALNRVSWIDQQTAQLLEQLEESAQVRNEDLKNRRIRRIFSPITFFYMRDMEKEGITKPRVLLKVLLEVLKNRFPEAEAYKYSDFYEDYHVLDLDGTVVFPKRGHGLGMANSLTTLIQVIIHRMILERIAIFEGVENVRCLVLNDDHVASFPDGNCLDDYECEDFHILKDLSIMQHLDKSMISRNGFVFCEEYYEYYSSITNLKESYRRRTALLPHLCHNIVEAKRLVASLCTVENLPYMEVYKEEYVSKFGYEFFPEEVNYSLMFGGWFTRSIAGVRLDLHDLGERPFFACIEKAYEASKCSRLEYRVPIKDRYYYHPLLQLFPGLKNPDLVDYMGSTSYKKMYNLMIRPRSFPRHEHLAWERLRKDRRRVFCKHRPLHRSLYDFLLYVWKDAKNEVLLPPLLLTQRVVPMMDHAVELVDVYTAPNPILSSVATDSNYQHVADIPENFSVSYSLKDSPKKAGSDIRQCQKLLSMTSPDTFLTGVFHDFYYRYLDPSDEKIVNSVYHSPMLIAKAYHHVEGRIGIPLPVVPPDDTLLNLKKRIFTRLLSVEEQEFFSHKQIYDRRIIRLFVIVIDYYPELFKSYDDILMFIIEAPARIKEEETPRLPPFSLDQVFLEKIKSFQSDSFKVGLALIGQACSPELFHSLEDPADVRFEKLLRGWASTLPGRGYHDFPKVVDRLFEEIFLAFIYGRLPPTEIKIIKDELESLKSELKLIYLKLPPERRYFEQWEVKRIFIFYPPVKDENTKQSD